MTGDQVKAYWYLLCNAWLQDATLPDDDATLASLARVSLEKWHDIKPLIMTKFEPCGGGRVFNDRQMAEWHKQHIRSTAAALREEKRRIAEAQLEHSNGTVVPRKTSPLLKTKTKSKSKPKTQKVR